MNDISGAGGHVKRIRRMSIAAAAYVISGTGTAFLAGTASSSPVVKGWRLAAWLLGLAVFCVHFVVARRGERGRSSVAGEVAGAVALGAFGVAALGPFRAHWAEPGRWRLVALSLVAWPILTGVPAYIAALLGSMVFDTRAGRRT